MNKKLVWVGLLISGVGFASSQAMADVFDVITTISSGGTNLIKKERKPEAVAVKNLQSQSTPRERLETYPKVADRSLLDEFYKLSEDGTVENLPEDLRKTGLSIYELEPQRLVITKPMYKSGDLAGVWEIMQRDYVTEAYSDALAKRYIAFAKKRGNQVKLYRAPLDIDVNKAVEKATGYFVKYTSSKRIYAGQDNVLIETGQSGEIVSILARHNQVFESIGAEAHLIVQLIYGRKVISAFENLVTNEKMRDMYLRNL